MVLIPLKAMPALLLAGGIGGLVTGEESPGLWVALAVIGAIWSYAWYVAPAKK
jgi:hypothetical protein